MGSDFKLFGRSIPFGGDCGSPLRCPKKCDGSVNPGRSGEKVLDSKPDISNLEDKKVDVDERDRMGFARNNFSEKDSSWSQPWGNLQRLHNNSNSNGDDNPVVMGDEGGDNAKKRLKKGGGMLDWQVSPPPVCDNFNHDPPSIVDGYWTDQLSQYPLPGSGSPFT